MREHGEPDRGIAVGFTASVALKFVLLLLEATEKRWILQPPYKSYPPEATSGILNRNFFIWLNSLFRAGFSKLLKVESLFRLDKHLVSERIHQRMDAAWTKGWYQKAYCRFAGHSLTIAFCSLDEREERTEFPFGDVLPCADTAYPLWCLPSTMSCWA